MHNLDTKTAFLHGAIDTDIYMEQPEGFEIGPPGMVCKLNKCLYGLKQAPHVWHKTLKEAFKEKNFKVSFADPCLLILEEHNTKSFAAIYVDDQIITGPNDLLNQRIKHELLKKFPGTDLGEPQMFIGLNIQRDFERRRLKLVQTRHIEDLLATFDPLNKLTPAHTPMDSKANLSPDGSPPFHDKVMYLRLVGSLLYLANATRPDIAYATSVLSKFNNAPTVNHNEAAYRVLRYLKTTMHFGLVYGNDPEEEDESCNFVGYADVNFGSVTDGLEAYGYAFKFYGAAVCWTSKKQDSVAKSTADAELVAIAHAGREALWLRKAQTDYSLDKGPIVIYNDNTAALKHSGEDNFTAKTRHIAAHLFSALEEARWAQVHFAHMRSSEMLADIFTKALDRPQFEKNTDWLLV
jgi:hypothetical protein